ATFSIPPCGTALSRAAGVDSGPSHADAPGLSAPRDVFRSAASAVVPEGFSMDKKLVHATRDRRADAASSPQSGVDEIPIHPRQHQLMHFRQFLMGAVEEFDVAVLPPTVFFVEGQ